MSSWPTLELRELVELVAEDQSVRLRELRGEAKRQELVSARDLVAYLAREFLKSSYPTIGLALGRDHSSAVAAYKRATARYQIDAGFRAAVDRILVRLPPTEEPPVGANEGVSR